MVVRSLHMSCSTANLLLSDRASPLRIRCGYEIAFQSETPTPLIAMLNVHPSRHADLITAESLSLSPEVPRRTYLDQFGNVCTRVVIPSGGLKLTTDFIIRDSGEPDERIPDVPQTAIEDIPDAYLTFLLGSRYCETEALMEVAWKQFGPLQSARDRVEAIVDFVHHHIEFGYKHARCDRTASQGYAEQVGVCRDYAHLAVTLCRCMNIPARYCTGYLGDIGVPPVGAPMDFSAWFEVYVDGRWYTYDARHNSPRIGRILMARGRDAADTALTTAFGMARLSTFTVWTDEIREAQPAEAALSL